MSDLIDRELLIEEIKEDSYGNEGTYGDMWRFMDTINKMPSVQPRRGKWDDIGGVIRYGCPFCHYAQERKSNFCPHCGADMRPQFEEPEINPCRGCEDYDGKGGCKTKGGCADRRGDSDEVN